MARGEYTLTWFAISYFTVLILREVVDEIMAIYFPRHAALGKAERREHAALVIASVLTPAFFIWGIYIAVNMILYWLWPQFNVAHVEAYMVSVVGVLMFVASQRVVQFEQKLVYLLLVTSVGLMAMEWDPFVCGPVSATMGAMTVLLAQQFVSYFQVIIRLYSPRTIVLHGYAVVAIYLLSYIVSWTFVIVFYALYWDFMALGWVVASIVLTGIAPFLDIPFFRDLFVTIKYYKEIQEKNDREAKPGPATGKESASYIY